MSQEDTGRHVDVVIMTALRLEFDAVLEVDAGAVPGSAWEHALGPNRLPLAYRSFITGPDRFAADLVGSLDNLGIVLRSLGQHEAALAAMEETDEIRRTLAARPPDAGAPAAEHAP